MGQGVARLVAVPLDGRAGRTALVQARGRPLARRLPVPGKTPARHRIHDRRAGGLPPRPLRENPPPSRRRTQHRPHRISPAEPRLQPHHRHSPRSPPKERRHSDSPLLGGLRSTIYNLFEVSDQKSTIGIHQSSIKPCGSWSMALPRDTASTLPPSPQDPPSSG